MAQLLSVRNFDPDLPVSHPSEGLTRNESSAVLIEDGPDRQMVEFFQNPVFQDDDDTSMGKEELQETASGPETRAHCNGNSTLRIELLKQRSLSPSDSGIHIPDDSASVKSENSLRSGGDGDINGSPDIQWNNSNDKLKESKDEESLLAIAIQVVIPFVIAGIGTCGAGLLLDLVEEWDVFVKVTEMYILVPTLLGLKGNLEMTLASRISTQANLGQLDTLAEQWRMCWGNMALIQCQATVLALLSSCVATGISSYTKGFELERALLLCASALFTASVASFLLGVLTLLVVLLSHRFHVNPDNVATPIAASLGDVTTLGILAGIASHLYKMRIRETVVPSAVCVGVFVILVPMWIFMTYRNTFVKRVLYTGWLPVVLAVIITSVGGYILEYSIDTFEGFSIFQPVVNGVAGNLVAVQASRISTYFHAHCEPGSRPPDGTSLCLFPHIPFCGKTPHARTALVLLAMVIPGHLLFGYGITLAKGGNTVLTPTFLPIYIIATFIQVTILLYVAQCLIHFLWWWKLDPDNWAIPLLTALGDLSGMITLTSAFMIHRAVT